MNEGLEALENILDQELVKPDKYRKTIGDIVSVGQVVVIQKELKELDKIKARLAVINMKLTSKREECVKNMEHTDEDDFVHEASKIEMDCLDWFREMLKEVLL